MWLCDEVFISHKRNVISQITNFPCKFALSEHPIKKDRSFMKTYNAFAHSFMEQKDFEIPFLDCIFHAPKGLNAAYIEKQCEVIALEDCEESILYGLPMYMILKYIATQEGVEKVVIENAKIGLTVGQFSLFQKELSELPIKAAIEYREIERIVW